MSRFPRATRAFVIGTAGLGATVLFGITPASGEPMDVTDVTGAEVAAAQQVAASPDTATKLAHFFVQLDQRDGGSLSRQQVDAASATKAPRLVGTPLKVYSLNPRFVAGAADASVAEFGYLSVKAESAAGQAATVWLTREAGGWEASNLTTGTEEVTYPAEAGADLVFTEPQINAWYRVRDGQVLPLNDTARQQVGAGTTVAGYQQLVNGQYGDKLPGSAYVRDGMLGGYQPRGAEQVDAAAVTEQPGSSMLLGAGAGLLIALSGVGWLVLRRRAGR
ncbi:hypothetical protein [Amycolatopsis nigrescens]|uniref:hypothetical protein n=1 Tax=Amycolatopsis nigrescens TaxID=381445 RepID=UPI0012F9DEBB|nr:hypothetical protein [Amycolatopsis nigrescens]